MSEFQEHEDDPLGEAYDHNAACRARGFRAIAAAQQAAARGDPLIVAVEEAHEIYGYPQDIDTAWLLGFMVNAAWRGFLDKQRGVAGGYTP